MDKADDLFRRVDVSDALEIALRNTRYETLEELTHAIEAEVLAWMRKKYPDDDVTRDRLRDPSGRKISSLSEFHNAMCQEARCDLCRERGAYKRCGGRYWEALPLTSRKPRNFYVWFRECGYYRTAMEDAERRKRGSEAAAAPKGFSLFPQTERRDIDA